MTEKIVVAVCGHPVLYDTTAVYYRDKHKKEDAWVKVSEEVGLPVEVCRRKWKGLRDTYLKKKKGEKRSGSAGGNIKKWRFSAVLSFLDPFTAPRQSRGHMGQGVEEDWTAESSYEEGVGGEAAAGQQVKAALCVSGSGQSALTNIPQVMEVKSEPDMEIQLRIGFIGAGNMAYGIAKGILSGDVLPANVKVSAPSTRNLGRFEEFGITVTHSNSEVVSGSDLVFLAVKPHLVPGVLSEISPLVTKKHIIVSVAAGVTLATLELLLPADTVTLRLMPNLPCVLQEGALLFSRGPCAEPKHAVLLSSLLQQCGLVEEGPEAWIDVHTGLSGSGVAFVYLFAEAMAEGAVKMGMPSTLAHSIAAQTIVGAGKVLRDSGKHPAQLRADVCTPGGTTIYGLHALERGGLRATAMAAVEEATQRASELGQKTAASGSRK